MATLINCRVCGGGVSSEAIPPCPHCKDPFITEERKAQHVQYEKEVKSQAEKYRQLIDQNTCPACSSELVRKTKPIDTQSWGYSSYVTCSKCRFIQYLPGEYTAQQTNP